MDISLNELISNYHNSNIRQSTDMCWGKLLYTSNSTLFIISGTPYRIDVGIKIYTNNNTIEFIIKEDYILENERVSYKYNIDTDELEGYKLDKTDHIEIYNNVVSYIKNNRDFLKILMMLKKYGDN